MAFIQKFHDVISELVDSTFEDSDIDSESITKEFISMLQFIIAQELRKQRIEDEKIEV